MKKILINIVCLVGMMGSTNAFAMENASFAMENALLFPIDVMGNAIASFGRAPGADCSDKLAMCISNAYCTGSHVCTCRSGYHANKNSTECVPDVENGLGAPCNPGDFLECGEYEYCKLMKHDTPGISQYDAYQTSGSVCACRPGTTQNGTQCEATVKSGKGSPCGTFDFCGSGTSCTSTIFDEYSMRSYGVCEQT